MDNESSSDSDDDRLLPLSGIQHFAFCQRQWALIAIENQWEDNVDTTMGEMFHDRAHLQGYSVADDVVAIRSMRLVSYRLGLVGFSDVVEFLPCPVGTDCLGRGHLYVPHPVEYKKGSPKKGPYDKLQLGAQALCLEEMFGVAIDEASLFYGATRHRERIDIDEKLRADVMKLSRQMHALFASGATPPPSRRAPCSKCSLKTECVPEIVGKTVSDYWNESGFEWR